MSKLARTMRGVAIKALQCGPIPQHVGFIMDGNRRYGRKVQVGTGKGYYLGYETLEEGTEIKMPDALTSFKVLAVCMQMGVKVVTVYAFSIENFKRPPDQVETLMELAKTKLAELCEESEMVQKYGIGIRVLGDVSLLPEDVQEVVQRAVNLTSKNTRAILNMCFPYTSREEMNMATRSLVKGVETRELNPTDITTNVLENSLYTRSCPPLDILVRTSGEIRLSDFMMWQSSRACHVEFIDCYWPEFTFWKMLPILLRYQTRATSIAEARREFTEEDNERYCMTLQTLNNLMFTGQQSCSKYETRYRYTTDEQEFSESTHTVSSASSPTTTATNPWQSLLRYFGSKPDSSTNSSACSSDTEVESEYRTYHRNSSESTLASGSEQEQKERKGNMNDFIDPGAFNRLVAEKQDRVQMFLNNHGSLPTCPTVNL
ncbi:cis-prenyltransferase [Podila humilis]|nr:cis-prenyltransferase [Podila humilis]